MFGTIVPINEKIVDITDQIDTSVNNTGYNLTIESASLIGDRIVIINLMLNLATGTYPISLSGKNLFGFPSKLKAKNNYGWVAGVRFQFYESLLYVDNSSLTARFTGDVQNTTLSPKAFVGTLVWVTEN